MNDLVSAVAIGAVAGLRAMTAPAAVSRAASAGLLAAEQPLGFFANPTGSKVLLALAAAELVADKLPFTPSRLSPGPIIARLVSGALCGAFLNGSRKKPLAPGAFIGAAAALGAAIAAYHLRQTLVNDHDLPDTVVALAEDAVTLAVALTATSLLRPATL